MNTPFFNFSIETIGGSSTDSLHETYYRLKQLNQPFVKEQIEALDRDGYLGCGQDLRYDLKTQQRFDSGDGLNFYWFLHVRRLCDSGD